MGRAPFSHNLMRNEPSAGDLVAIPLCLFLPCGQDPALPVLWVPLWKRLWPPRRKLRYFVLGWVPLRKPPRVPLQKLRYCVALRLPHPALVMPRRRELTSCP